MTNLILCGGSGTRLWPISRTLMPKQFVKLFDSMSLFQLTLKRNLKLCDKQMIISNKEQYYLAYHQSQELGLDDLNYLLEPVGKNTAPAIALSCFGLDYDEIVLVTPSDHLIKDQKAYESSLKQAEDFAKDGYLVTFGIKPTFPETGFGYIEADGFDVLSFKEKPDEKTAKEYLEKGNYYWNSGMFCFKAGVFLDELQKHSPKLYHDSKTAYEKAQKDQGIIEVLLEDMQKIQEDSIDYAVMENSSKVKVVPSDIGWSDLGSFDALYEEFEKDQHGNNKNKNHISIDSKNNLILADDKKIVATVDIEDLIVVDTADALLISKKGSSQKVKKVVDTVKKTTQLHTTHLTVHRPWGSYTVLEDTEGFKVKRIEVRPDKRLSLQRHKHRNEHWVVVEGSATVTKDDDTFILEQNQSTYIKAGQLHRLYNHTDKTIILVETQVGSYTGEDDIERVEDDFKR